MKTALLACLGLCWALHNARAQDHDAQKEAVAALEKLGGKVTIDADRPGKPVVAVDL